MASYQVFACWPVGQRWTARKSSAEGTTGDYQTFPSREEAQAWADQKNREIDARRQVRRSIKAEGR